MQLGRRVLLGNCGHCSMFLPQMHRWSLGCGNLTVLSTSSLARPSRLSERWVEVCSLCSSKPRIRTTGREPFPRNLASFTRYVLWVVWQTLYRPAAGSPCHFVFKLHFKNTRSRSSTGVLVHAINRVFSFSVALQYILPTESIWLS